jgi:membrane protein EpsK
MSETRQTRRNLYSNAFTLVVGILLGLYYTPYLVRSLGIVAYGIVPLALVINQYINVITGSLTGALTRFYSVAIQQDNIPDASRYLSSSFVGITVLVLALLPVFALIVIKVDAIFTIPEGYVQNARVLFSMTILSFVISLYSSLLNITLYAKNRLDLMNHVKILRNVAKVLATILFFEAIRQDVAYIGHANAIAEVLTLILSIYYFVKVTDRQVRVSPKHFEKGALLSVLAMTTWVIIHQLGDTGLYRIDNILVNIFWSTRESGILGALSEFGTYVMTIIAVFSSLFGPLILIAYSKGNQEEVVRLSLDNSLFVGILTALLVGLLIGFAKPIIGLWLGDEYAAYSHWFILKQVTLPFYAAAGIFAFVYRAWNRVKFPALFTLALGALNFIVAYVICFVNDGTERHILYLLVAATFFIVVQSYGLNAYYFWKLYPEVKARDPLVIFLKILAGLAFTAVVARIYTTWLGVDNLVQLLLGMTLVSLIFLVFGYIGILNRAQRGKVLEYARHANPLAKK